MISHIFRLGTLIVLVFVLVAWSKPRNINLQAYPPPPNQPVFTTMQTPWADSVFLSLSLKDRIAQLFMVQVYSNKTEAYYKNIDQLVQDGKVGGIIFFQGGPARQIHLVNRFQQKAQIPVMIGMDAEWGPNMRMADSTMTFPRQMQLGAIANDSLIFELGQLFGEQLRMLGATVNFAPVVDVNNNPNNPVIFTRSFGEDPKNVAVKGLAYAQGLESTGVMAVAKHFPGHGDTRSDSHKTLPRVMHKRARLDSIELYPFRHMIKHGISGIMNAHLYIPALDAKSNTASSLSRKVVTRVLKNELGFNGLAFTDALGMKGVAAYHSFDQIMIKAFNAGNDVLLMPKNFPKAQQVLLQAVKDGKISKKEIYERCHKILKAKEWMGLHRWKPLTSTNIFARLNSKKAKVLRHKLQQASMVIAHNANQILPLKNLENKRIASLSIGKNTKTTFQKQLRKYAPIDAFAASKHGNKATFSKLIQKLSTYDVVLIGIHNTYKSTKYNYGITKPTIDFVHALSKKTKVVLTVFANPYSLKNFKRNNFAAIIVGHRDQYTEQLSAAQVIFGGIACDGKLPVSAGSFKATEGNKSSKIRLSYISPKLFPLKRPERIQSIEKVILGAIRNRAFPGCQLIAAYNGQVFLHKSYGHHTYRKKKSVHETDIYDLASITKINATLPLMMQLVEQKKINVNKPLANYLTRAKNTDKAELSIKNLLLHQTGLKSWIPFYAETYNRRTRKFDPKIYSRTYKKNYTSAFAKGWYILDSYSDTIVQRILNSELGSTNYRYSDLGLILLKEAIEEVSKNTLDAMCKKNFFAPLGTSFQFKAWENAKTYNIIPSENDKLIRKQIVKGYVHDITAAQFGGIAGHAGLFGNATDVATMMQLFLNKGKYGGKRYLQEATIDEFTRCYNCDTNRRGLGFDKPLRDGTGGPCSVYASHSSYGHSGFTGGLTWADPKSKFLFVFLTNRTYPSANNKRIIEDNVRTQIQSLLYQAVGIEFALEKD